MAAPSLNSNISTLVNWTSATLSNVTGLVPQTATCNQVGTNGARRLFIADSGNVGTGTFFGRSNTRSTVDLTGKFLVVGWGYFSGNSGNLSSTTGYATAIIDGSNNFAMWIIGGQDTAPSNQVTGYAIIDPSNLDTARYHSPSIDLTEIVTFEFYGTKGANTSLSRPFSTTIRSFGKQVLLNGEIGDEGSFTNLSGNRVAVNGSQIFIPYRVQIGDGATETIFNAQGQSLAFEEQEYVASGIGKDADTHIPDNALDLEFLLSPTDNITINAGLFSSEKPYSVRVLPTSSPLAVAALSSCTFFGVQDFISRDPLVSSGSLVSPSGAFSFLGGTAEELAVRNSTATYAVDYQKGTSESLTIRDSATYGLLIHYLADLSTFTGTVRNSGTADIALNLQWSNGIYYLVGAIVYDANASSPGWYVVTSAGTSSGTGVDDDTGATWTPRTSEALELDLSSISFGTGSTSPINIARLADGSSDSITITTSQQIISSSAAPGGINVDASVASLTALNFEDNTRVVADHVQVFTVDTSTDVDITNNTITLSNDANGDAPAFASLQPYTLVRLTGDNLPNSSTNEIRSWTTELGGGLYYATINGSNVRLFTAFGNIPATPISLDSTGSGTFNLRAETVLFNVLVSGGSGLSQALSLSNGAQIRVRACKWDSIGGNATSTTFFDNRDNLTTWSASSGASISVVVGLFNSGDLETIHEEIIDTTFARSRKFGELTTTNDGSQLDTSNSGPFQVSLEGLGRITTNTNDPDGKELIQNAFAWYCWVRYQEGAISIISGDTFQAVNFFDYQGKNLAIDNLNASIPFQLVGGSISIAGIATGIGEGSESVYLNVDVAGTRAVLDSTGSSVTVSAIAVAVLRELIADHSSVAGSLAAFVNTLLTISTRVDGLIEDSSGDRFTTKALETGPIATGFSTFDPNNDTVANVTTVGSVIGNVGGVAGTTFPTTFNNLSVAQVESVLADYDGPTRAELTSDINSILNQGNSAWVTATGFSTFDPAFETVVASNMRGTDGALISFDGLPNVTVGGYASGQAPNELIDISGLALEAIIQSCLSAATALADGRFIANYTTSTATQYNIDGNSRTVFDLYEADGITKATSAQTAVERRPQ
ncbi:MAG: hypothetical protein F6K11_18875 [Leptolyngbya sp. SIO3F4]|nr:hypothetical protein [Leptolyngbya sp. SIO3F4]